MRCCTRRRVLKPRLRSWRKSTHICAISAAPCSLHGAPTHRRMTAPRWRAGTAAARPQLLPMRAECPLWLQRAGTADAQTRRATPRCAPPPPARAYLCMLWMPHALLEVSLMELAGLRCGLRHLSPHGEFHHFCSVHAPRPAVRGACHVHASRTSRAAWLQPRARSGCDPNDVSWRWCRTRTACEVSRDCPTATACRAHRHVDCTRAHHVHQQHAPGAASGRASARQKGGHFLLAAI